MAAVYRYTHTRARLCRLGKHETKRVLVIGGEATGFRGAS